MALENELRKLRRAVRRLEDDQSRQKRRNARRAVLGAIKSVRYALDKRYPRIEKPAPPPAPKPAREPKPRLPFVRAWDMPVARLMLAILADVHGKPLPKISADYTGDGYVYIHPEWSHKQKWERLLDNFSGAGPTGDLRLTPKCLEIYRAFWSEQIPVSDIRLAAEHLAFLEKRGAIKPEDA